MRRPAAAPDHVVDRAHVAPIRTLAPSGRDIDINDGIQLKEARDALTPDFSKGNGLLPAIAQDVHSGRVLMLAYMNQEAWEKTASSGEAHYWSRSRQKLWHKGEESGNIQVVHAIYLDCDLDTILIKVEQKGGAACHKGYESCFYRRFQDGELEVVEEPVFDPKEVYKK